MMKMDDEKDVVNEKYRMPPCAHDRPTDCPRFSRDSKRRFCYTCTFPLSLKGFLPVAFRRGRGAQGAPHVSRRSFIIYPQHNYCTAQHMSYMYIYRSVIFLFLVLLLRV